jgi:hypothetical protein
VDLPSLPGSFAVGRTRGAVAQVAGDARAASCATCASDLDDALSSVDTRTEERILGGLQNAMLCRAVILVSHRVSTAAGPPDGAGSPACERLLDVDEGDGPGLIGSAGYGAGDARVTRGGGRWNGEKDAVQVTRLAAARERERA